MSLPAASTLSPFPTRLHLAWMIVLLLMPVALLNYLDRQMLASMKYSLMADIPSIASETNWGWILAYFKWVYAILSPIGGYVADRFSRRFTICISLFVWSLVTWWTGHVTSYHQLLWTRSLMGISEAFYMPAALAMIADYHLGATRSRAVGLHQTALYIGQIVGGFSGYVADSPYLGWRAAFVSCGAVGAVYALPLMMLLKDASTSRREPGVKADPIHAGAELLGNLSFILLVLYFTLPAIAAWVVRDWGPAILKQQFNIRQGPAGVASTLSWQSAAIVGAIVGGWLADYWTRQKKYGPILASAIGTGLLVPAIFGIANASALWIAVAALVIFGLGWGFFDSNNMPILSLIVRPHLRATGYGIMNMVSTSCGGLADWGFGALRDRKVPLPIVFGIFAAFAALSIVLVLLIRPKPNAVTEEQTS
jgi:MFS family permease